MRVTIVGSGSEGNATLFEAGATKVLVDAGLSLKRTRCGILEATGRDLDHLDAVVITHAHSDHIAHTKRIAKAYDAPVFIQPATLEQTKVDMGEREIRPYTPHARFRVGALRFAMLPVPHDTPQVAVVVRDPEDCVGLVTDLGHLPKALTAHLRHCRTLLLESNHDPEMLSVAPYPLFVRTRIAGSHGHLANIQTARLLRRLAKPPLERVVLMHLSRKANSPEKAYRIARKALGDHEVDLQVAAQNRPMLLEERAPRQLSLAL